MAFELPWPDPGEHWHTRATRWVFKRGIEIFVYSSLWTASALASLVLFAQHTLGLPPHPGPALLLFFSALFIYNLDHVVDSKVQKIPDDEAQRFFSHWFVRLALVVIALTTGLMVSNAPPAAQKVFGAYTVIGLVYGLPLVRYRSAGGIYHLRLKDIPFIKAWLIAFAVTTGVIGLPVAWSGRAPDSEVWQLALFVFVFTSSNAHMFDVRDIESDRLHRVLTLPVAAGIRRTKEAVILLNLVMLALMMWGWAGGLTSAYPEIILSTAATVLYVLFIRVDTHRLYYGIVVEGCLYLPFMLLAFRHVLF